MFLQQAFQCKSSEFSVGTKPEARPAQSDLKIVQIFYMALRNNISFVQIYIPISICIHAWVVMTFPHDELLGRNGGIGGMLKWQLTLWLQLRVDTVLLAFSWGYSLPPFSHHKISQSQFTWFLKPCSFYWQNWRKTKQTNNKKKTGLFAFLSRDLIEHPKQWHLRGAPDQRMLSLSNFNRVNATVV